MLFRSMNYRIMRRLERQHALTIFQFGFRAGKEVLDACTQLVHDIVAALRRREVVEGVMLDIKSAYDTVWREGLVHKLVGIGLDPYIVAWLQSLLTDQYCRLEIGDATIEVWPECGLPQGSPLSVPYLSSISMIYFGLCTASDN